MEYNHSEYQKYFQAVAKYTRKHIDTGESARYTRLSVCISVSMDS